MLHNSGSYGPEDTAINTSAPLNMTQMSAPLNLGHNLQNISEMGQQPSRMASGNYNLPHYPAYNHQNYESKPHLNSFSNYHIRGFESPFAPHSSSAIPHPSWQNSVAPLNLNAQSTFTTNMTRCQPALEKKQPSSTVTLNTINNQVPTEKNSLNIPPTRDTILKPNTCVENFMYNTNNDRFNYHRENYGSFDTNNLERIPLDDTKRKSLENTVKLIENILINTTKCTQNKDRSHTKTVDSFKDNDSNDSSIEEEHTIEKNGKNKNPITSSTNDNITKTNNDKTHETDQDESSKEASSLKNRINDKSNSENSCNDSADSNDECEETVSETPKVPKVPEVVESEPFPIENITIKLEPMDEHDSDSESDADEAPFFKDINGMAREDVSDGEFINKESSLEQASVAVKNGCTNDSKVYYECPHCYLVFNHPKRFLIHAKWHTFGLLNQKRDEEAREKEYQRQLRRDARSRERMNAKVEKAVEEDNATYPCKDCSRIFSSKGSLKNHRNRFHSGRIRECNICGAVALGWAGLKAHAATHLPPFTCPLCDKRFTHKHSIARHMETHADEQEKTLPCETCGKLFAVESRLKEHRRVHLRAEQGPIYRCSYCAKAFYQSYSLTIHERTHRNEKPYSCEICKASYGTNSSLKRHLKVSHNRSKPFECPQCARCFLSARGLTAHTNKLHPGEHTGKRKKNSKPKKLQKAPKVKKNNKETEIVPLITEPVEKDTG